MPRAHRAADAQSSEPLGDGARAAISVLLFVHLFIVACCLASSLVPSQLEQRMMRLFRPYAQLLNFQLDGTRFDLTQASVSDVDQRIEVMVPGRQSPGGGQWQRLAKGVRAGERYHRYQRLAQTMAFFQEDEETTALIAQAVARGCLSDEGLTVQQLRCRQHLLQSWDVFTSGMAEQQDPLAESYFTTVYMADVIHSGRGRIDIVKRAAASQEAAPDRNADGTKRSTRWGR